MRRKNHSEKAVMNEIALDVVILPEKLGLLRNMSHEIASFIDVSMLLIIKFTILIIYKK